MVAQNYWRACWNRVVRQQIVSGMAMNRLFFVVPATTVILLSALWGLAGQNWRLGLFFLVIAWIVLEVPLFIWLWIRSTSAEWMEQHSEIECLRQEKTQLEGQHHEEVQDLKRQFQAAQESMPHLEGILEREDSILLLSIRNSGALAQRVWARVNIKGSISPIIRDASVAWLGEDNAQEVKIALGETRSVIIAESRSMGALPHAGGRLQSASGSGLRSVAETFKAAVRWNWYVHFLQNGEHKVIHSEAWSPPPYPTADKEYEQQAQNRNSRVVVELQIFSEPDNVKGALAGSFELVGRSLIENFKGNIHFK